MTEDFAYSHGSTVEQNVPGYVGVALPGVQVRISPDGEVLIKSPGRMVGYFKRPDLNAECFTEDGFFRTGDMGELRADGLLKITGRVKELFKTGKGKYVAPAPIENRLNAHPMVESAIVSGVGQQAAYALVVLAEALRPRLQDPAVRAEVEQAMAGAAEGRERAARRPREAAHAGGGQGAVVDRERLPDADHEDQALAHRRLGGQPGRRLVRRAGAGGLGLMRPGDSGPAHRQRQRPAEGPAAESHLGAGRQPQAGQALEHRRQRHLGDQRLRRRGAGAVVRAGAEGDVCAAVARSRSKRSGSSKKASSRLAEPNMKNTRSSGSSVTPSTL